MKNLLHQFAPLRCTTHTTAALVDVCAHVLDGTAPHYADEQKILCLECHDSESASLPLWPVCVVCLRLQWGLTISSIQGTP